MKSSNPIYLVSGFLLFVALTIFGSAPHSPSVGNWLLKWQTLVAGFVALFGAYWTVKGISWQIEQAALQRRDDIMRRHRSARVALPLALDSLSGHLRKLAKAVADRFDPYVLGVEDIGGGVAVVTVAPNPFELFEPPSGLTDVFRDFIETVDNPNEIRHISEIISTYQIVVARMGDWDPVRVSAKDELISLIIEIAKIFWLTDAMFNYGRFVDEASFSTPMKASTTEAWIEIKGKVGSLLYPPPSAVRLLNEAAEKIDRYSGLGLSPWNQKFGQ